MHWIDNGTLFYTQIANLTVNLAVDSIGFCIDGIGEVNDKIRVGSNYSIIEKNIKYLIEKRSKAKKPEVFLSMCDYGKTEKEEMEVYQQWISVVDRITLIPYTLADNTLGYKKSDRNILHPYLKKHPQKLFHSNYKLFSF